MKKFFRQTLIAFALLLCGFFCGLVGSSYVHAEDGIPIVGDVMSTVGEALQGVGRVIEDAATPGPSTTDKCAAGVGDPELAVGCTPVFSGGGLNGGLLSASGQIHGVYKERSLVKLIAGWLRFLLPIIAFLTFIAILIAGWFFVTSGGEDGQHEKAKKTIIWASIGLIVVLGAYAIVNTFLGGIA